MSDDERVRAVINELGWNTTEIDMTLANRSPLIVAFEQIEAELRYLHEVIPVLERMAGTTVCDHTGEPCDACKGS